MPAKGQDKSMQPSLTIARLIGPVFCVIGIGMLANGDTYRQMATQFLAGYPFIYLSGILALFGGLAILNAHNAWTRDWRSVITALGWLMTFGGTFRIFAPQYVAFIGTAILTHSGFFIAASIVLLALGSFITFKGYVA
jgi:drug/metabolite transporter (DMT)-like permease